MTITHGITSRELLVATKSNILNGVSLFSCILLLFPYIGLAEDISLIKKGGVYELPVEINGVITLNFILDTGSSEVNIPADVALTLYRTGTIRDTDFLPGQAYRLADGSTVKSSRFVLRHLKIGQRRIDNVAASFGPVLSPLLLGQSFLEKLGTWGINSQKQVLVLGPATTALSPKTSAPSPTVNPPAWPPSSAAGSEERQGVEANPDSTRISPLIPVLGNAHKVVSLLTQMVTLAMQNGGEGQEAQLEALKQQIEALPKPKRGDYKAARLQNDKGLEEFKKGQHEQALQFFLAAYQLDASDAEVVDNIGFMYLKTGSLEEAARYLGGALSLTPNREMAWKSLAEVFAHGIHPEEAVAAYALMYRFSKNKDARRRYLETEATNAYDPLVMQAAKAALALSLLK